VPSTTVPLTSALRAPEVGSAAAAFFVSSVFLLLPNIVRNRFDYFTKMKKISDAPKHSEIFFFERQ
jgi:hypothetical protein